MGKGENKMIARRLVNAYLSSIISIALVLLLIGVAVLVIANARSASDYFKENVQISVLFNQDVSEEQAAGYQSEIASLPYIHSIRLVGREEGTADLTAMLGEDFLSVFESSPVPVSLEVTLEAEYVASDSLAFVIPALSGSELVDEVSCQQNLVDALNANLTRISLVLGVLVLLLLFISFVLINNTVRLNVFARRFTVHTMRLVGATRGFIRRPFVLSAVWQGLASSVLALGGLAGLLLLLRRSFEQLSGIFSREGLVFTGVAVVACGVFICVVSTFFVVNKLISSSREELYF